ncbi:unnamed protein product [Adineta ricciae]|uniref:Uncharacterized protein n=1 Tax=Adineta ricciae TaxID=249248 RepID=A0A816CM97_ADIRI|nr:unnamed protein product [Adineta ricciae]
MMKNVEVVERHPLILIIFVFYLFQHVQTQSPGKPLKQLDKLDQAHIKRSNKDIPHVYSSSNANNFLSYDKCIQRMKCPSSRKEECGEECRAGNTEEEIEEHIELTRSEHRNALRQKPKARFEDEQLADKRDL